MTAEQEQDNEKYLEKKYLEKRDSFLSFAEGILHSRELADDAVQQAFEIAWRKMDDWRNSPNPDGWIQKTLKFAVLNIESRQRTERGLFVWLSDCLNLDWIAAPEDDTSLRVKYGSLVDTPEFQLLYQSEVMGRTLAEIAQDLGISEAACKKRAERARKFLRRKMKK